MFKFQTLDVWKKAIAFCDVCLKLADTFPQREQFSLGEQLRRAAISVPNNIAEGTGRTSANEAKCFYNYAKGSVYEVVNLLVIAAKRGHLSKADFQTYYGNGEEIAKMLTGLIRKDN